MRSDRVFPYTIANDLWHVVPSASDKCYVYQEYLRLVINCTILYRKFMKFQIVLYQGRKMRCFHRPGWVFKANRYYTRVLTKNRSRSMLLALILIVHLPCVKNSRAQGNVIFLRARDLYLRARGHVKDIRARVP